jgi:hypothetical protein
LQAISKVFSVLTGKAGGFIDLKVYKNKKLLLFRQQEIFLPESGQKMGQILFREIYQFWKTH